MLTKKLFYLTVRICTAKINSRCEHSEVFQSAKIFTSPYTASQCVCVCVRRLMMLNYTKKVCSSVLLGEPATLFLFHKWRLFVFAISLSHFIHPFLLLLFIFLTSSYCYFINDPLLFSISLSHSSTPSFLRSLLLLALHSKLSRVANHYPQSQALNQRIFTLSVMRSPSLTLSLSHPVCVYLPG